MTRVRQRFGRRPPISLRFHPGIQTLGEFHLDRLNLGIVDQIIEAMGVVFDIIKFFGGAALVPRSHRGRVGIACRSLLDPGHPEIRFVTTGASNHIFENFGVIEIPYVTVRFRPRGSNTVVFRTSGDSPRGVQTERIGLMLRCRTCQHG